jgi:hypothetical protein
MCFELRVAKKIDAGSISSKEELKATVLERRAGKRMKITELGSCE